MKINDNLFDKKIKEELNLKHSRVPDSINKIFDETIERVSYKRKFNSKKVVGIAVACIMVIIITGGVLSTPAIAAKIPIVGEIYRKLGLFKDIEEYTNSIGESKEVNGYSFTIDNIVGTPNNILVSVKVVSPIPFTKAAKLDNLDINVDLNDMEDIGIKSFSSGTRAFYIDDYTAIVLGEIENNEGKFKSQGDLNLTVSKSDEVSADFSINFNFKTSFSKVEKVSIGEKINDNIIIDSLETTVIKTGLIFKVNSSTSEVDIFGRGTNEYYLELDGKLYGEQGGGGSDGIRNMRFPTVKYHDIKNAESINIVCVTPKDDIVDEDLYSNVEWTNEEGIKYPKSITSKSGLKGRFYKVDKTDGILRLYFESEYNAINLLNSLILSQNINGEKYGDNKFATAYKNGEKENSYVFEFKDVDFEKNSQITFWGTNTNLDKIKDVKIIKVK